MKELFASILAHTAPHLPYWILKRMYSETDKLVRGIHFSFKTGDVEINLNSYELRARIRVLSTLPFDVKMKYLEFSVQPERKFCLATVTSAREFTLKAQDETTVELAMLHLTDNQVSRAKQNPGNVWLFGKSDIETPFHTGFTVELSELSCAPNIYGI